jgi:LmbE family N-acetylglucosaminyl deacetylase
VRKIALVIFLSGIVFPGVSGAEESSLKFTEHDRILVIAPHPDDEALGVGGVIQSAKAANSKIKVVYLTSGEANEVSALFYKKRPLLLRSDFVKNGLTRKNEAVEAMTFLGLSPDDLVFLGYPDGGILNIWTKYWGNRYRFKGEDIVHDFEKVLLSFEPTHVFITAPFDLNLDHQGAYLYFTVAWLNVSEQLLPAPQVHLYLVHAHQWPASKKYPPKQPLPAPSHMDWQNQVRWYAYELNPEQVAKKQTLILKYKSQVAYKKNFLLSFARTSELFCDYPPEPLVHDSNNENPGVSVKPAAKTGDVVYRLVGKELWLEVPLTNALDEMGVLSTYVFAYRKGFLFSEMPKLMFKLFGNKMFAYDGFRPIHDPAIVYKLDQERFWIRIPLSFLKDPDTLFVSTRNAKEMMSLDFGSWKIIVLLQSSKGEI